MTRLGVALLLAVLGGCSCEAAPTTLAPPPSTTEIVVPAPIVERLPAASRADLPATTPATTLTVRQDVFLVSNRGVVETWPEAERDAVGRTRPLGDADYPIVEREIEDASDALAVPGLRAAMLEIAAVESARAAIVHAAGTPTAFAVRADADVHFGRVLAVVFAAAMVGLNQPRLVLASADGDRELRLTAPGRAEPDDPAVAAALAEVRGRPLLEGTTPRPARVSAVLEALGLTFRRGDLRIGAGCAEPVAADTVEPTIATASITASAIDACVSALRPADAIVFRADRETRYADAVAVLEALSARHEVNLAVSIE